MQEAGGRREREAERSPTAYLRTLIASEGGSISVERFMQEALYHPRFGYYARRVGTVGRTGDFSTSATLHPVVGEAVAAWAHHGKPEVAQRGRWHLVELGGGTGELAGDVLQSLGWRGRFGLRYHLVEVSAPLRKQQQQRLGTGGRVRWHETIEAALDAADGRALIFSNEFVDAFPCGQWTRETAEWREVRVAWPDGQEHPEETTAAWSGPLPSAAGQALASTRQRVEAHPAYRRWLAAWAGRWRAGRMLTIDYGDRLPALYHRQPHGTLRAYCRHQRFAGAEIYRRFGQQDLTADVNFSDLQTWGEESGWETTAFLTQAEFLRRWLPARRVDQCGGDPRATFLLDPAGAGGAFKVLEQRRKKRER